jgi:hypothetical protein
MGVRGGFEIEIEIEIEITPSVSSEKTKLGTNVDIGGCSNGGRCPK